jgi:DNA-binding transcriptional MerR regulator
MQIGQIARLVGRSTDTLKRWDQDGLLVAARDSQGRRVYDDRDLERARELAAVAVQAQRVAMKMAKVLENLVPRQMALL